MKLTRRGITLILISIWLLTPLQAPGIPLDANAVGTPTAIPRFGSSVALDSDTVLVGAFDYEVNTNDAYIFYRNQGGINAWGGVKQFGNWFDPDVTISGDTAAVIAGSSGRALYILYRNQGGPDNWGQVKMIQRSDLLLEAAVALNGDTLVVGAQKPSYAGDAVYVFQRNQGGTDQWGEVKRIPLPDGETDFSSGDGQQIAIHGDMLVVGAPYAVIGGNTNQGAVYVFSRNEGGANNWSQVKKIIASDGAAGDVFGVSVSIYGDLLVSGAGGADVNGKANQGAAYIFSRNQGGANNWGQVKKIVAADGAASDGFSDVSIYQDTLAVGAEAADISGRANQGAAYVFSRNQGGTNNWGQIQKITASDGASGTWFGRLQVNGSTIIVGVPNAKAAYLFDRDQGGANNWGQVKKLLIPDVTPPTDPTSLQSNSHSINVWSNDNTVNVSWATGADYESGMAGYSILWDTVPSTIPAPVIDLPYVDCCWAWTTSPTLADGAWYFHVRAVDNAGNWTVGAAHLGPFKIDTTPPTSSASTPGFASGPFEVRWAGTDVGSGVANYDVWVRDGLGGTWTQWQSGTSAVNATFTYIVTGHTYYFRSLAHDVAGNLEADLPADGDTHTTIAAHQVTGQVTNNRAQSVFNATVSADPMALNTAKTSGDGSHALFFGSSGVYTLTASRTGYGALPSRYDIDISSNLSGVDFVLPPFNDVVINGGWESGDSSGWSLGAGLTTTVETTAAHTGHYGLRLESSGSGGIGFAPSITQSVVISAGWSRPTLSWLYQVTQANPGDALLAVVSNGSTSITATVPITIGAWQHDWLDLSMFSGQTVTLQFGFQTQVAGQQVMLDEISVGDSFTSVYPVYLPLIRRNS